MRKAKRVFAAVTALIISMTLSETFSVFAYNSVNSHENDQNLRILSSISNFDDFSEEQIDLTFHQGTNNITIDDVIALSIKSDTVVLKWSDFIDFNGENTSSEASLWEKEWTFKIDDEYTLKVCGKTDVSFPDHVYLSDKSKRRIDIRTDDVKSFLNKGIGEDSLSISEDIKEHFRVYETYSDENTKPERRLVQDFKSIMRCYNIPVRSAFTEYNNIDDILASSYVLQKLYVVEQQDSSFKYYDEHLTEMKSSSSYLNIPEKAFTAFSDKDFVNQYISSDAELDDIYYLSGETSHMGTAIYYKTNLGDYVYYNEMLFPIEDFCKYQKAISDELAKNPNANGNEDINISDLMDLSKYELENDAASSENVKDDISCNNQNELSETENELIIPKNIEESEFVSISENIDDSSNFNSNTRSGGDSFDNAYALSLNSTENVSITYSYEKKYFSFTPVSTGFYSFESFGILGGDPYGKLYNQYQDELDYSDDYTGANFKITYHLISGVKYYLTASSFGSSTGIYSITVYSETNSAVISSSAINISSEYGNNYLISSSLSFKPIYCKFIPPVTGEYLFYSFSQSSDPSLWLYSDTFSLIGSNDDGAGNLNFRLSSTLYSGQTYYLVMGYYLASTGYYSLGVGMSVNIPTDDYYIKNVGSELNVDIHGPGAQEWVHQWSFHTDDQQDWKIQKQNDGYYTIRSEYGSNKYIGISTYSIGTDNVKLYSTISDNTKWKIYTTYNGKLFFEPKNGAGMVLYAPDSVSGTELQLEDMSYTLSDRNKWIFEVKSSTPLEGQRRSKWCWAASARMFVNHYYNVPDSRSQNNAVSAVLGSEANDGANNVGALKAGNYYRSGSITINDLNLISSDSKRFSENDLKHFIDDNHVVFIGRGVYGASGREGGHATVIVGYTTMFINGNLQYRYIIYDPWPNPQPDPWNSSIITNGQTTTASYQWICNGQNGYGVNTDHDPDYSVWDGFVVVQTSYSGNILDPIRNQ